LEKLAEILPSSGPEELTIVKSKIALQTKKLEKTELVPKEKEKEIIRLKQEIGNIQTKIVEVNDKEQVQLNRVRENIRKSLEKLNKEEQLIIESNPEQSEKIKASMQGKRAEFNKELTEELEKIKFPLEALRVKLNKELNEKLEDLEVLENLTHKPLHPSEMVNSLIFPYPQVSLKQVLGKASNWIKKESIGEISGVVDYLSSIINVELLKSKVDLRKDFLETTKEKLPLLAKLPKKPGDKDSILHVINSFKEKMGVISIYDHQLYAQLTNIFSSSLYLLIDLRGQLKLWENPSKYIELITNKSLQVKTTEQVNTAKSGGGLFSLLKGQNLTKLAELIKNVESLTEDYSLFYDSIIAKNSRESLILKLREYRKSLQEQIDFHHKFFQEFRGESPTTFVIGKKYHENLSKIIITSCFDTERSEGEKPALSRASSVYSVEHSLTSIILEYLGIIPSFFGGVKYYQKQIEYTDIAITWLNFCKFNLPTEAISIDKSKVSSLPSYDNPFSYISHYLKDENLIFIISEYAGLIDEFNYLSELKKYEFNQKLSLFLEIKEKLEIVDKFILKDKSKRPYLKYALETLDLIQIDLDSSKFLKIYSRPQSVLEFIQKIIDLVIYITEFLNFANIKSLNENDKLLKPKITILEKYLTEKSSLEIKNFIESIIAEEESVLDNFTYLINYKTSKTYSSKLESYNLLEFLTRLIDHTQCTPEKLLNKENLKKVAALKKDGDFLLGQLIESGYVDVGMIESFPVGDVNEKYKGRTLLNLVAQQLAKVGRVPELNYKEMYGIPQNKKFKIDPKKQDKLIDVGLCLIEQGADINLKDTTHNGFLTTLFSMVSGEQTPYLYKKLLSNKTIVSKLDLSLFDSYGRNLLHLFCRDMFDFFYSIPIPAEAKDGISSILTKMIGRINRKDDSFKNFDFMDNTPGHYLASSVTSDYLGISINSFKEFLGLNEQNKQGDTPLHIPFTRAGDPVAFYKFVLTDVYPPTEWLKCPHLGLKIKNDKDQSVLDMVISSKNKLIASIINTYIATVIYSIDLEKYDGTFETARQVVNEFLKTKKEVPSDEIEQTIYLQKMYDPTKDSSSSCSSLSSSSSSSMPSYSISSSSSSSSSSSLGSMSYSSSSTSSSSISEVALGSDGEIVTIPGRATRAGTELSWHPVPVGVDSSDTIPLEKFLSGDNGSMQDHCDM